MRPRDLLLCALATALAGAALPAPGAQAHQCVDVGASAACDPDGCASGTFHEHTVLAPYEACASSAKLCPPQYSHTYGFGSSVGASSQSVSFAQDAGLVTVWHATAGDCDGDGAPGGFDGDYESGMGGGFFGYGPWADEATCAYGLNVHGPNVAVFDFVWGNDVQFVVGASDMNGPTFITDPVSGEVIGCETDGTITPTTDADDCVTPSHTGTGATCGAGGDGGYWVFLTGLRIQEDGASVESNNPATVGTITAY